MSIIRDSNSSRSMRSSPPSPCPARAGSPVLPPGSPAPPDWPAPGRCARIQPGCASPGRWRASSGRTSPRHSRKTLGGEPEPLAGTGVMRRERPTPSTLHALVRVALQVIRVPLEEGRRAEVVIDEVVLPAEQRLVLCSECRGIPPQGGVHLVEFFLGRRLMVKEEAEVVFAEPRILDCIENEGVPHLIQEPQGGGDGEPRCVLVLLREVGVQPEPLLGFLEELLGLRPGQVPGLEEASDDLLVSIQQNLIQR